MRRWLAFPRPHWGQIRRPRPADSVQTSADTSTGGCVGVAGAMSSNAHVAASARATLRLGARKSKRTGAAGITLTTLVAGRLVTARGSSRSWQVLDLVCELTRRTPHAVRRAPRHITDSVAARGFLPPSTRRIAGAVPSPRIDFERPVSPSGIGQSGQPSSSRVPRWGRRPAARVQTDSTTRRLSSAMRLVDFSATAMSRPRGVSDARFRWRRCAAAKPRSRQQPGGRSPCGSPTSRSRTSSPRVPPRIALALIRAEADLDAATHCGDSTVRPGSVYAGRHSLTHGGRRHGAARLVFPSDRQKYLSRRLNGSWSVTTVRSFSECARPRGDAGSTLAVDYGALPVAPVGKQERVGTACLREPRPCDPRRATLHPRPRPVVCSRREHRVRRSPRRAPLLRLELARRGRHGSRQTAAGCGDQNGASVSQDRPRC